jgi:Tol biopolymer transport system component
VLLEAVVSITLGAAAPTPRIVYASDWSGSSQLYAVDPASRARTGQLTFGRPRVCLPANPCGYSRPVPSPDGRRVLFWDFVSQGPLRASLYVANADGRARRRLATVERVFQPVAVWAPDSRRIAYTGADSVRFLRVDGSGNRPVSAIDPARFSWSADGRFLAALSLDGVLAIAGGRKLALGVGDFSWAPKGDRLAYVSGDLYVVRAGGRGRRRLVDLQDGASSTATSQVEWSPSGRWISFSVGGDAYLADAATGAHRAIAKTRCCSPLAWSPTGGALAVATADRGLVLFDARTGTSRALGDDAVDVAWAPSGREIAYVLDTSSRLLDHRSDLRVATVGGAIRTLVPAAGTYGGRICCVAWTRPPRGTSYRPAAPRSLAAVSGDGLVAGAPVTRLAADGDRVAYVSCGHVFVWTPATGEVEQAEPQASLSPNCSSSTYFTSTVPGGLALAGDRIAYVWSGGGNTIVWWLGGVSLPARSPGFTLGTGMATRGSALLPQQGSLVSWPTGSGDLLVYSTWTEVREPAPIERRTTRQAILRVGAGGCPCPEIASSPGPLVPYDVDAGRVVAGGDNATVVYDANGAELLVVPVSPLAAQLDGSDLVVLRRGELRAYDAATGALRHVWSVPDVPSGAECERLGCSQAPRLVLADAARGLVAYVLDGTVHLLRLADGADATVAPASTARFVGSGLVVADGPRLRLLGFERLPLRAF